MFAQMLLPTITSDYALRSYKAYSLDSTVVYSLCNSETTVCDQTDILPAVMNKVPTESTAADSLDHDRRPSDIV